MRTGLTDWTRGLDWESFEITHINTQSSLEQRYKISDLCIDLPCCLVGLDGSFQETLITQKEWFLHYSTIDNIYDSKKCF